MTELAKILILKGFDSEEVKDFFKSTFEQIKGKELKLEYSSVNGITLKKETHSTIVIHNMDDMGEQINDLIDSLAMEAVFSGHVTTS